MIIFRLDEVLSSRAMTQADLVAKTGLYKSTVSIYCNNKFKMIGLDVLNLLCETLNCEIHDLLEYIPDD